jgi:uncharacterized phage-associated protein
MRPRFRERKATQASALLLELSGGSMNYYVLLKILYLADRKALLDWGQPITFDDYVSMDHGPVPSTTCDLVRGTGAAATGTYWAEHITEPHHYQVALRASTDNDGLSDAEIELLRDLHSRYGRMTWRQLRELCHEMLPEWRDPQGSSVRIEYEAILRAGGRDESDIRAIMDELEFMAYVDERLIEEKVQC